MALVNNGTIVSLPTSQLPSGYSIPTGVTTFTDSVWTMKVELSILKSTIQDATPSTTMGNIISNGTIGVDKQVDDIIAADFLTGPSTTYYTDILVLKTTQSDVLGTNDVWLDNVALSYLVTVQVYLKN